MQTTEKIAIVSFYSFVNLKELDILLSKILSIGKRKYLKGTVLLAEEGFNGYLAGSENNVNLVVDEIIKLTGATDVMRKTNYCDDFPFQRLKVKIKPEIIAMAEGFIDVQNLKGEYIEPKDWDNFVQRDDVILVDTRNKYEIKNGTFKGAIDPQTDTFKQFPKWAKENLDLLQGKKIAMCCTGGVRCEKSTAYLKALGHKDVYHLKGGILQYLEDTNNKNGIWEGECFVFDDRRTVDDFLRSSSVHSLSK
jgi:UPF0176 protein